jgi:peptide subunit release factor 1 (eRF1)
MGLLSYLISFKCPECGWKLLTQVRASDFDPETHKLDCPKCKIPMEPWEAKRNVELVYKELPIDYEALRIAMKRPVYVCLFDA